MRLPILGLAGLLLAGCQPTAPAVDDAWVRLPAVPGRPGAAYFTLAATDAPRTLLAVRSPAALRSELHESMAGVGGMMSMAPLSQVDVPAKTPLTFAPGGKHVMLFDVNPTVKAGDETKLTLSFADGSTIETTAAVRGSGDPAP